MDNLDLFKNPKEYKQSYILGLVIGLILMMFLPSVAFMGINGYIGVYDPENYKYLLDPTSMIYSKITNEGSFFIQAISYVLISGIFIVIYYTILKEDLINFKKEWKKNLIVIVVGFIGMYLLNVLMEYLFTALHLPTSSQNQDFIVSAVKGEVFIYVAFAVVILAPIVEEIVFRKMLFGAIESNLNLPKIVVVIISTVIFSLIHLSNELGMVFTDINNFKYLVAFFLYAPLAFVLSFTYSYTKNNIYVAIILHALNNLLSLIFILIG